MEKEMITAEDIILKLQSEHSGHYCSEEVKKAMIEFAKLHVEAALKEASENADMSDEYYQSVQEGTRGGIDIETILNSYPLDNIK